VKVDTGAEVGATAATEVTVALLFTVPIPIPVVVKVEVVVEVEVEDAEVEEECVDVAPEKVDVLGWGALTAELAGGASATATATVTGRTASLEATCWLGTATDSAVARLPAGVAGEDEAEE